MRRKLWLVSFVAPLIRFLPSSAAVSIPFVKGTPDATLPLKIKVGSQAPDFVLESADGRTVRLSDFAGRGVLIDFYRGYW
jgi:hypothetical protein